MDDTYLRWPFFEPRHRELATAVDLWASENVERLIGDHHDADGACRRLVAAMGQAGWLAYCAPDLDAEAKFDLRSVCLIREIFARYSGLADFAFAMQGLGTATVTLFGDDEQRRRWTAGARNGSSIAAFAISEREAGSDVAAMSTVARRVDGGWRLNGEKTWISNGGIADQYVVIARTEDGPKSFVALMARGDAPGLEIAERIQIIAPHPMARIVFNDCFI